MIDKERVIQTFIELIEINSPSFHEDEIGEYLSARLAEIGFSVLRLPYDRSFNLLAKKRGSIQDCPSLLLSAHMDTIEPTEGITYSFEQGVISSRGATVLGADDKSGIAQILEALAILHDRTVPHGDLEILFTSAEEKGLCGARNMDVSALRSRWGLVTDVSGPVGKIVIAAPSHDVYELHVTGRAAHAGIEPEKGLNAIRVASEIISSVPDGRIDDDTTANIGVIAGGTATNVVPLSAVIRGEVRSHSQKTLSELREAIFNMAREITSLRGAQLAIKDFHEYDAYEFDADDPWVRFVARTVRDCGIEPSLIRTGGGSDANVFNRKGLHVLNISTGMQQVHSGEEFVHVEDLVKGAELILRTVVSFPHFAALNSPPLTGGH